jgi:hypothetical protein
MKHDNRYANYMTGGTLILVEHTQNVSAVCFNKTEIWYIVH